MDGDFQDDEPAPTPAPRRVQRAAAPSQPSGQQGPLLDSFMGSKAFQDMVRAAVLDALRSPEGQSILTQAIRKELARNR